MKLREFLSSGTSQAFFKSKFEQMTKLYIFFFFTISSFLAKGQVGVNTVLPENSAVIELKDNERGVILPRITTTKRLGLQSTFPTLPTGLLLFDSNDNFFYYYNASNSANGSVNWQGLTPFIFKDFRNDFIGGNWMRTIETHNSVRNIKLFVNTVNSAARDVTVKGSMSISSGNTAPPSTYGLHVQGQSKFQGTVEVTNKVSTTASFSGLGTVPIGGIILWSGSVGSLPAGYRLCDGNGGTPNLTERFVRGAGGSFLFGSTGGSNKIEITIDQMPSHDHEVLNITGTTSLADNHRHLEGQHAQAGMGVGASVAATGDRNTGRDPAEARYYTSYSPYHSHTITLGASDATEEEGGDVPRENRPEFYVIAFIMRVN